MDKSKRKVSKILCIERSTINYQISNGFVCLFIYYVNNLVSLTKIIKPNI